MVIVPWRYGRGGELHSFLLGRDSIQADFVDSTENEVVTIKNEALSNERMSYVNKTPGRIVCLIWGQESVLRYVAIASTGGKCLHFSKCGLKSNG
jgi:hypothetical protein